MGRHVCAGAGKQLSGGKWSNLAECWPVGVVGRHSKLPPGAADCEQWPGRWPPKLSVSWLRSLGCSSEVHSLAFS